MSTTEPEPLPPGFRLDRYLIQAELAPAGMGRVYRALDTSLNEVVAVNLLAPTLRNAEGLMRFRIAFREARMKRPAEVHDYGEWEGIPYVVVAYEAAGTPVDVAMYREAAQQ